MRLKPTNYFVGNEAARYDFLMKKLPQIPDDESQDPLWTNKRERQARFRERVRKGEISPESGFLFSRDQVKKMKIKFRD